MFENIIGNTKIKETLANALEKNLITHSYMFVGTEGIGKKMFAIEFAKNILHSNNSPDYTILEPEGTSVKIEQIRNIQEKIGEKPTLSDKKVYIIDNADLMTKEAQNALLKTLEEPPEYIVIILIGKNENEFLPTIKSRCNIINFKSISDEEMKNYLQVDNISKSMLQLYQGSILKANILKNKCEEYKNIEKIVENLQNLDFVDIIEGLDILYKSKEDVKDILEYINVLFSQRMVQDARFANCIEYVEETKKRLKMNANYDMSIDLLVFKIWEEFV